MVEKKYPDSTRRASILEGDGQITTNEREPDIFVVHEGKVAVGGSRTTHKSIALDSKLHREGDGINGKPIADDGGEIFDDGENLVIPEYFTQTVQPALFFDSLLNSEEVADLTEIGKVIRRNTGQLIANITGRNVVVQQRDGTVEQFSPKV